jgi:hypothetical protein
MWHEGEVAAADAMSVFHTLGLQQQQQQQQHRPRFMHTAMASGGWSNRRLSLIAGIGAVIVVIMIMIMIMIMMMMMSTC